MKAKVISTLQVLLLFAGMLVMIFPFAWMLLTSLKTLPESISIPPTMVPADDQWGNYAEAVTVAPFDLYLRNSIIVAGVGTLLTLFVTVTSAYAFTVFEFPGKKLLFLF